MTFVSRMTVAAALAVATTGIAAAPALAQALSPDVGKPLQEASNLSRAGNTGAAMARVNAARAAADTAVERRKVAEMAAFVHSRSGQWGAAARELESIGAPASQLAPLYYRAGDLGKAIALGKKIGGVQGQTIVAQSYFRQGNFQGAADVYNKLIAQYGARESWLQNLANVQYKMDDKKGYLATTQRLIKIDPSPARWRALLIDLKNGQMPRDAKLSLFQLMRQTNNVSKPEDYQEFAKLAIVAGQPGTAARTLEEGVKSGVIAGSDSMTSKLIEASNKRHQASKAKFASLPKTPAGYLEGANALFGEANYKAAAEYYAKASGEQALMGRGISLLRSGDKAGAIKSFNSVGEDSAYKAVATLWSLYAQTSAA
jgi:tetratricopeptide (TPR) repeat protein